MFCFMHSALFPQQPLIVSRVDKLLRRDLWAPESFAEEFGKLKIQFILNSSHLLILAAVLAFRCHSL